MQFTSALLSALFAASSTALPQTLPTVPAGSPFGLITIRSGSPIQNAPIQAALNSLLVDLPQQNATCTGEDSNYATFVLKDEKLLLYSGNNGTYLTQTLFVDRSGMGQGVIGYLTGAEEGGDNWERTGWALNEKNELQFSGTGFQACPGSIDGAWSIWLEGSSSPGGNQNCTGVIVAAVPTYNPIACEYTRYE